MSVRARAWRPLVLGGALALLVIHTMRADTRQIVWYADIMEPPTRDNPLTLRDGMIYALNSGWSCLVGHAKRMAAYEVRTTSCRKGKDVLEFSVQCDRARPQDHVQVRFPNAAGVVVDYIEVGCRPGGS